MTSLLRTLAISTAILTVYVSTASMTGALGRHITDGCLQQLRDVRGVGLAFEFYLLPAQYLGRFGPVRKAFELMSDFWCVALAAPETT